MGSGVPGKTLPESTVGWNIYRPIAQKSEKFGRDAGRRVVMVANGDDLTFGSIRDFEPQEQIEPMAVASGYPGLMKHFGDFAVQKITGGAIQQGDFIVIKGGGTHIQVCFQEMASREPDGSVIQTVKPSFLELYVVQPGPREDVVGCKEIVFRAVTDINLRNEPLVTASEQDRMVDGFIFGPEEMAQITIPNYGFNTPSGGTGTNGVGSPDDAASKANAHGFSVLSQVLEKVFESNSEGDETASMKEALASIFEGSDRGIVGDWAGDENENPTSPVFGEIQYERSPGQGDVMEEEEKISEDIKIEEPLPPSQAATEQINYDSEDLLCEELLPGNLQPVVRAESFGQILPKCSPALGGSPKFSIEQEPQVGPQESVETGGRSDLQIETPAFERERTLSFRANEQDIVQTPEPNPQIEVVPQWEATPQQQYYTPGWIGYQNSRVGIVSETDPNPQWLPRENEFFESNRGPGMGKNYNQLIARTPP
ncbi:hypothetical protein AA313_de0200192 [Arthrobotrys entomopaga]|nr:hypothetical protein AA313_de0200192 [Arthrobotrys entomopaga]